MEVRDNTLMSLVGYSLSKQIAVHNTGRNATSIISKCVDTSCFGVH